MNIEVREGRLEDSEFLAEGNIILARETEGLSLDRQTVLDGVRAVLKDARKGTYFVAEADGRPCGQLLITHEWSDWRNGDVWWIQSVYVLPEMRRAGVFRQLHSEVRRMAIEAGAVGLRLYVERHNEAAQNTYARLGMSLTGYVVMEEMFGASAPDCVTP
ncbi:MAG: hypothetical protein KatS3mg024_1342 [Armatimonadota bacterium]|nr:MAG: hypothetical protein KatS3mg024_1342 [Armatimonadota bacterium]